MKQRNLNGDSPHALLFRRATLKINAINSLPKGIKSFSFALFCFILLYFVLYLFVYTKKIMSALSNRTYITFVDWGTVNERILKFHLRISNLRRSHANPSRRCLGIFIDVLLFKMPYFFISIRNNFSRRKCICSFCFTVNDLCKWFRYLWSLKKLFNELHWWISIHSLKSDYKNKKPVDILGYYIYSLSYKMFENFKLKYIELQKWTQYLHKKKKKCQVNQ